MSTFPAANYLSNAGRTEGEMKTALEDFLAATKQLPGGKAETTLTIAAGVITPIGAIHTVDTEAAAATDDLTNIAVTNTPDGSMLLIRPATSARVITCKYAAAGTGQLDLVGQMDVVLSSTFHWLLLKLSAGGVIWTEVARFVPSAVDVAPYSRLDYTSTSLVTLTAGVVPIWNSANAIWQLRLIPDAGVTLGNGGLSASTGYYIYAVGSGGAVVLEASVTGRAISQGVMCKSGDRTRTLVGWVYTDGSSQFVDTTGQGQVVSWYSRRPKVVGVGTAGPVTKTATSADPLATGCVYLQWGDAGALVGVQAIVSNNTTGKACTTSLYLDGSPYGVGAHRSYAADAESTTTVTKVVFDGSDALHVVAARGHVDANTGSWSLIEEWARYEG